MMQIIINHAKQGNFSEAWRKYRAEGKRAGGRGGDMFEMCDAMGEFCLSNGNVDEANQVLRAMAWREINPSKFYILEVSNAIVEQSGYLMKPSPKSVISIIDQAKSAATQPLSEGLSEKFVMVFNTVIKQYARKSKPVHALTTFTLMIPLGILPDAISYNHLMQAYVDKDHNYDYVEVLFWHMHSAGVQPDPSTVYHVMEACLKKGSPEYAENLCDSYGFWDDHNVLILSKYYASAGDEAKVLEVIQKAKSPNSKHVHQLLLACAKAESPEEALYKKAISFLDMFNVELDQPVFNTLVQICMRTGIPEDAEMWYEKMIQAGVSPNAQTFNKLLNGFAELKMPQKARKWLDRMAEEKVPCSDVTYSILLKITENKNDKFTYLHRMQKENIPEDKDIIARFVRVFDEQGEPHMAEQFVKSAVKKGILRLARDSDGAFEVRLLDTTLAETLFKVKMKTILHTHDDQIQDLIIDPGANSPIMSPLMKRLLEEQTLDYQELEHGRLRIEAAHLISWKARGMLKLGVKNTFLHISDDPSLGTESVFCSAPSCLDACSGASSSRCVRQDSRAANRHVNHRRYCGNKTPLNQSEMFQRETPKQHVGVIKSYDAKRKSGFIECPDFNEDVYVHRSVFNASDVEVGDTVRFKIFVGADRLPRADRPLIRVYAGTGTQ